MELKKWQLEVELTKLPKMLQETYKKTLKAKGKEGQIKDVAKYRLSHLEGSLAIVNDCSNPAYHEAVKKKYDKKAEKRRKAREPQVNKLKALKEERNKLKKELKESQKGQKTKAKRLMNKKLKAEQLAKEIALLEKEI